MAALVAERARGGRLWVRFRFVRSPIDPRRRPGWCSPRNGAGRQLAGFCRSPVVTRRSVRALAGPRRAAVDHYLVGRPVWRVRTRRGRRGWTGSRVSRASQDSPLRLRARAQRPLPSVCYVGDDRSRTTVARRLPCPNAALSLRAASAAPARADRASSPAASAGTAAARPTRRPPHRPAVDRQPGGELALRDRIRRDRLTCADSNALRTPRAPSCLDRPNRRASELGRSFADRAGGALFRCLSPVR